MRILEEWRSMEGRSGRYIIGHVGLGGGPIKAKVAKRSPTARIKVVRLEVGAITASL